MYTHGLQKQIDLAVEIRTGAENKIYFMNDSTYYKLKEKAYTEFQRKTEQTQTYRAQWTIRIGGRQTPSDDTQ